MERCTARITLSIGTNLTQSLLQISAFTAEAPHVAYLRVVPAALTTAQP